MLDGQGIGQRLATPFSPMGFPHANEGSPPAHTLLPVLAHAFIVWAHSGGHYRAD
jgi:hypothetical protein